MSIWGRYFAQCTSRTETHTRVQICKKIRRPNAASNGCPLPPISFQMPSPSDRDKYLRLLLVATSASAALVPVMYVAMLSAAPGGWKSDVCAARQTLAKFFGARSAHGAKGRESSVESRHLGQVVYFGTRVAGNWFGDRAIMIINIKLSGL